MDKEITRYIEHRYARWLDYSLFHCTQAGISDEASDVLNEVVLYLLEKNECKLLTLYNTKKGQYRELDFYVLRMIKLNIYSPTSPYQNRYKPIPKEEVELSCIKLVDFDDDDDDDDKPARIFDQINQVRTIADELNLSDKAKRIFKHRFILGLPLSEWDGPEQKKELYETYNKVVNLIKQKLNGKTLI
jgi:hypothetical protein